MNVRLTTNASQSVTSSNHPDAFGLGSVTAGTASAYSYGGAAGYREDGIAPTGLGGVYALQKVGARYYDPTLGCFLTRDTDLSQRPYAYCDGDPVNQVDPTGHGSQFTPDGLLGFAGVMYTIAGAIAVGLLLAAALPIEVATIVAYLAVSAIYTALFVGSVSAGAALRRDHDAGQQTEPRDPPTAKAPVGGPSSGGWTIWNEDSNGVWHNSGQTNNPTGYKQVSKPPEPHD